MSRVARRPFSSLPRCWNRNESIVADGSCRSPADGSLLPLCIELAVTQTNFIVECANEFKADPHCGTFLEVHRPGFAEKIGEARLRAMYPSGYRMTVLSTTYKGDQARTLCYDALKKGRFELWWVQRTRYNFVVERRIPFSVSSPECDWDDSNNRYLPYATLFLPDGVTRRARLVLKHDAPNAHDTEAAGARAVVEALDARLRSIPLPKASAADAPRLTARRKVADIDEDSPEDTTDEASSDDADSTAE